MKVRDLIERLQRYDPNLTVYVDTDVLDDLDPVLDVSRKRVVDVQRQAYLTDFTWKATVRADRDEEDGRDAVILHPVEGEADDTDWYEERCH